MTMTKTKLVPFEPERYIQTPEAQAAFLEAALETGDASHIAHALGIVAKAHGMSDLAKQTGLNRATLYAALSEGGNPTLDTVMKVVRVLGLSLKAEASVEAQVAA